MDDVGRAGAHAPVKSPHLLTNKPRGDSKARFFDLEGILVVIFWGVRGRVSPAMAVGDGGPSRVDYTEVGSTYKKMDFLMVCICYLWKK